MESLKRSSDVPKLVSQMLSRKIIIETLNCIIRTYVIVKNEENTLLVLSGAMTMHIRMQ